MRLVIASLLSFLVLVFLGCDRHGTPVRFVLPEGFHGVFQISEDPQRGVDLVKSNGMLLVTVPINGRVVVKDWSFLTVWHSETAIFPDGKVISGEDYDTNSVALHSQASQGHTTWVVVGTARESDIARILLGEHMPLARQLTEDDLTTHAIQK